jgi:hypothetical protein
MPKEGIMSHKNGKRKGKGVFGWGETPITPKEYKAAANLGDLEAVDDPRTEEQIEADDIAEMGALAEDVAWFYESN